MIIIVVLMLASLIVALVFLSMFIWAVRHGQYDDMQTPAMRMLTDDADAPGDERRKRREASKSRERKHE